MMVYTTDGKYKVNDAPGLASDHMTGIDWTLRIAIKCATSSLTINNKITSDVIYNL